MNNDIPFDTRRAERDAAEWLVKLDGDEPSVRTEAEFEAWLAAHPSHEAVYARCAAAAFLARELRSDPELRWVFDDAARAAGGAARSQGARRRWARFGRPTFAWSAAAAVAAALVAVYLLAPVGPDGQSIRVPQRSAVPLDLGLDVTSASVVELPGQVVVDARSVAVLPFIAEDGANADGAASAADARRFAASLHDQIVTQLAAVPGFYVAEPRSVLPYSEAEMPPRDIAVQLGVRGVVQGRVRLADGNVRVNLRLTDATNDSLLLVDDYDRTVGELGSMELDITADIALALADASRVERLRP